VLDPGAVAVALRQLWTGAKFKSKDAVLGVASRRILVREYTTQAMRPDLLREALPFQVQDLLPVPASQAVLDFFPLAQNGDQVSGLLVAAVSDSIEQIISTLAKVKVRAQAVDLTAFGLARATASLAAPEETVATVSIGDHTTQVVISRGGVPHFVRLLPIDVATAAVRRHSAEIAEPELQLAAAGNGSGVTSRTRGAMRAATPPGASDLAARVRSTLAFFGSRTTAEPLTRLFVTGAGAAVEGVMTALAAAIDTPMTIVSAGDVVSIATPPPAGDVTLNLVGTIGIALGEAGR
jgi:type IV pilus assembly protein PilM